MNTRKLVGNAKRDALVAAAYQTKMVQRYGKNSTEYNMISKNLRKG